MALTPTEREEHFFKAMVDAADGSTPEELEPTERKEHWYQEIIDAIKAGGGGSGGLPPVTESDVGKVATVDDSGVWGAQKPEFEFWATSAGNPYEFYPQAGVSFTDVARAYMQGRKVYLIIPWQDGTNLRIPLTLVAESRDTDPDTGAVTRTVAQMVFNICDFSETYITIYKLTWDYGASYLAYSSAQVEHT